MAETPQDTQVQTEINLVEQKNLRTFAFKINQDNGRRQDVTDGTTRQGIERGF